MNKKLFMLGFLALLVGQAQAMSWFRGEKTVNPEVLNANFAFKDNEYVGLAVPNAKKLAKQILNMQYQNEQASHPLRVNKHKLFSSRTINNQRYLIFNIKAYNTGGEQLINDIETNDINANSNRWRATRSVQRRFGYGYTSPYEAVGYVCKQLNKYAQEATRKFNKNVTATMNYGALSVNIANPGQYMAFTKFYLSLNDLFVLLNDQETFNQGINLLQLPESDTPAMIKWTNENKGHIRRNWKKYGAGAVGLGAAIYGGIEAYNLLSGQQTYAGMVADKVGEYFAKENLEITPEEAVTIQKELDFEAMENSFSTPQPQTQVSTPASLTPEDRMALQDWAREQSADIIEAENAVSNLSTIIEDLPTEQAAEIIEAVIEDLPTEQAAEIIEAVTKDLPTEQAVEIIEAVTEDLPTGNADEVIDKISRAPLFGSLREEYLKKTVKPFRQYR